MFKLYSEKKLILAFEYGVILSDILKDSNKEISKGAVKRLEEIIRKEFPKKNPTKLSVEMIVNILAAIEPK